jgi:hypothetical protein
VRSWRSGDHHYLDGWEHDLDGELTDDDVGWPKVPSLPHCLAVEPISILGDAIGPHPSESVAVWIVMGIATAVLLLLRLARRQ